MVDQPTADVVVLGPSGQLVRLDEPTDVLAQALHDLRQMQDSLKAAKRAIDTEVLDRMDQRARWTAEVGDYRLKGQSPPKPDYDARALWDGLFVLVVNGVIDRDALFEAAEPYVEYKAKRRGINALLALDNDRVTEAIDAARTVPSKGRYVTVERVRP